jgi:hypothetical protein
MIAMAALIAAAQPGIVLASAEAPSPAWRTFVRGAVAAPRLPSRIEMLQRAVARLPADRRLIVTLEGPSGL